MCDCSNPNCGNKSFVDAKLLVESYLDSLPLDSIFIDISNRNLTEVPNLSRFTTLEKLNCSNNKIVQLFNDEDKPDKQEKEKNKLPDSLTTLYINNNRLKTLFPTQDHCPKNLLILYCNHNALKSIDYLPHSLIHFYCNNNKLKSFINPETNHNALPNKLELLHCHNNDYDYHENVNNGLIHKQFLPDTLQILYCDNTLNWISPLDKPMHVPSLLNTLKCYVDGNLNKEITILTLTTARIFESYVWEREGDIITTQL